MMKRAGQQGSISNQQHRLPTSHAAKQLAAFQDHRPHNPIQQNLNAVTAHTSQLQSAIDQSPIVQRHGKTSDVIQRATDIKYGGLTKFKYQYGVNPTDVVEDDVGTKMVAELDPKDPKTGTDTSGSDAFNNLFTRLQGPSNGSTWVRGHLLNHDLGGIAHYNNLFPITTAANGEHYHEVEKQVKHWVANKNMVTYEVDAKKTGDDRAPAGEFVCNAKVTGYYGGGVDYSGEVIDKTIKSSPVKVAGTRHYSGGNVATDKYSDVELGGTNTVFRDSYKGLKKDARWQHRSGNGEINNQAVEEGITAQVGVAPEIAEHAPVLMNDEEVGNGEFDQDAIEEVIADQQ